MKRNQIFREKNKKKRDKQGAQSAGREEALTHWLVDYPSPFSPDPAMDATAAATLAEIHVWYRHLSPRGLRQGYGPTRRGGRLDPASLVPAHGVLKKPESPREAVAAGPAGG